MTPRARNLAEIEAIAELYDFTLLDILGKSKTKMLVAVRRKCVVMLRDKGYSTTEIGRIMQRDHSTIVHALSMNERDAGKALAIYEMKGRLHDAIQT